MTVSYSSKVATSSFSCFLKLLLRWRGSIYKLLWKDFAVFAGMYYTLSFTYRFLLAPRYKRAFESVSMYCQEMNQLIPVAFVLGFYVSIVVNRWWEQFKTIPYPNRMAMFVTTLVMGTDERGRLMRRTIMRYLNLTFVMTMSSISPPVKKRFPQLDHMRDAGFLMDNEQTVLEGMKTTSNKYFVPLVWAASVVTRARKEGRIKDDFAVKTLIDEINEFRGKCGTLFSYDWVTIPLVYTQVVTLAVYMFFISCLMGRQFLENGHVGDMYFPFFTFLQFFFYLGWLKVAETLLNPFGEDDDDFDINGMIDRNLQVSYVIVDEMYEELPEMLKDQYWDDANFQLPYTEASQQFQKEEHVGSAANIEVSESKAQFLAAAPSMSTINEDVGEEQQVGSVGSRAASEEDIGGRSFFSRSKRGSKYQQRNVSRQSSRVSNLFKSISRRPSKSSVREHDPEAAGTAMLPVKTKDNGRSSPSDDLQFKMSDDEQSPTAERPVTLHVLVETSPMSRQKVKTSIGTAEQTQLDGTKSHGVTPTCHLEPLVETAETQSEFANNVLDQLREMRTGTSVPQGHGFPASMK